MFANVYIYNSIALIILGYIFIYDKDVRTSKRLDDKLFKRLGFTMFCLIVMDLLSHFCGDVNNKTVNTLGKILSNLIPSMYLINCFNWLVFVDAAVYNDMERIKGRYRLASLPIIFMIVVLGIEDLVFQQQGFYVQAFWLVVYLSGYFIISIGYIYKAYKMARTYQKEVKAPIFLRLDIFFIPWIIGFFGRVIDIDPLCETVGLFLTYCFIKRRYKYLDSNMVFYNENFVDYLQDYEHKVGIKTGDAIILYSSAADVLSLALEKRAPENSVTVRTTEDYFIVYTDIRLKSAIQVFIITLQDEAVKMQPDINIEAQYLLKNENESVKEITERLKTRLKTYDRISHM